MGAQAGKGKVDVLVLDVLAEGVGECALDEFWLLGAAEGAEGGIALVSVLGGLVLVEEDVVFLLTTILEDNSVDTGAEVGVESVTVTSSELLEHVESSGLGLLVTSARRGAKQECLELLLDVTIGVLEFPANLVCFLSDKTALEVTESILCLLVLEDPGIADGANASSDLIPNNKVGLGVEGLEQ